MEPSMLAGEAGVMRVDIREQRTEKEPNTKKRERIMGQKEDAQLLNTRKNTECVRNVDKKYMLEDQRDTK
jgi:hypothetical protein